MDAVVENKSSLDVIVGQRMREERKLLKLTLADLAERTGTTPQTIQRIETAQMTISVDWVERICAALGIQPAALFAAEPADARFIKRRSRPIRALLLDIIEDADKAVRSLDDMVEGVEKP